MVDSTSDGANSNCPHCGEDLLFPVDSLDACPECGASLADESDPEAPTGEWAEPTDDRPQGPEGTHLGRADQSLESISPEEESSADALGGEDTGPLGEDESSFGEQPPTKEVNPLDDIDFGGDDRDDEDFGLDEGSSTTLPKPETSPGGLDPVGDEPDTDAGEPSLSERLKRAREKSQVRNMNEEPEGGASVPGDLEPEEPTGFPTLGEDTERALDEAVDSATGSSADEAERADEPDEETDQQAPSTPPPMPGPTSPADRQRQSPPPDESPSSEPDQKEPQEDAPQLGAEALVLEDEDPEADSGQQPAQQRAPEHAEPDQPEQTHQSPPGTEPPSDPPDGVDDGSGSRRPAKQSTRGTQESASALGGWLGTLAAAVVVLAVAGIGYVYFSSNQNEPTGQTTDRTPAGESAAPGSQTGEIHPELDEAIGAAREVVDRALAVDPGATQTQLAAARRLTEREDWQGAATVWTHIWEHGDRESTFDPEVTTSYLDVLSKAGQFAQLRRVALDASQRFSDSSNFAERFRSSIDSDPELGPLEPVELGSLDDVTSIANPDDSDMPGLAIRDESGQVTRVFLAERNWNSAGRHWRDAVATWRLCRILPCGFRVPETRAARVTRSTLEKLASPHVRGLAEAAGAPFIWSDGTDGEVLRGALVEWPGGLKRWPIEAFQVWRPWLDADNPESNLDKPVADAFAPFADVADGYDAAAVAAAGDASLREVSRQLSQLLLTDYLLNNWGRFASQPDEFGSRNHMADGRFITVRTDTAFQLRNSTRVKGRFRWTSRFSRDAIDAIEILKRGDLADHLFPEIRPVERNKMEIFWNQRDRALERVSALVERHGHDPVFIFE